MRPALKIFGGTVAGLEAPQPDAIETKGISMSDTGTSHPFKHEENLAFLSDEPGRIVPDIFTQFYNAIDRAKIPDNDVYITKKDDVMTVHFRSRELHQKFLEAFFMPKEPVTYLPAPPQKPHKVIDFDPALFIIAHMERIEPGMDASGEVQHCIDICKMCHLENFRVISEGNKVKVFIGDKDDAPLFKAMESWIRVQKAKTGMPIKTGNPATCASLSLIACGPAAP